MSGRSGYGRSKIVGKLIHLPANMMMAGLAPRVGKPGWAIRLYYQRVDECFCCIPIKITRRVFITGNVTNANLSVGMTPIDSLLNNALPDTTSQSYYGIVFSKKIAVAGSTTPLVTESIKLTSTVWNGAVLSAAATSTIAALTSTDFQILPYVSGTSGIGKIGTSFAIDYGSTGAPGAPSWNQVNTGTGVETNLNALAAPNSKMAYLVTNTSIFGGYTLLFNVTQVNNASYQGISDPTSGTGAITAPSDQDAYRTNFAAATFATNNISTTFTPGQGLTVFTEDCFSGQSNSQTLTVNAPVSGFAIAAQDQPVLELLQ